MTVQMEHVSQLVLASSALYGAAVGGTDSAPLLCLSWQNAAEMGASPFCGAFIYFGCAVLAHCLRCAECDGVPSAVGTYQVVYSARHRAWFSPLPQNCRQTYRPYHASDHSRGRTVRPCRCAPDSSAAAAFAASAPPSADLPSRGISAPPRFAPRAQVCHACRALRSRCCAVFGADGKRRGKRSGTAALLIAYFFADKGYLIPGGVCFRGNFASRRWDIAETVLRLVGGTLPRPFCILRQYAAVKILHHAGCTPPGVFRILPSGTLSAMHRFFIISRRDASEDVCIFKKISLCGRFMPQNVIQW